MRTIEVSDVTYQKLSQIRKDIHTVRHKDYSWSTIIISMVKIIQELQYQSWNKKLRIEADRFMKDLLRIGEKNGSDS